MKKLFFGLLVCVFIFQAKAQTPFGCNLQAIRDSFAAKTYYTEVPVSGQPCSLYFIDSRDRDATLIEADARLLGAHMAIMDDATENGNVSAALWINGYTNGGKVLIGYRRQVSGGAFFPTDGTTLGYTAWQAGRPDNQRPPCYSAFTGCSLCSAPADVYQCANLEQCVEMQASSAWNDIQCQGRGAKSLIEVSLCPVITANNDTAVCAGSTVNINTSITKGSTPYTYLWSTTQTTQNISVVPVATTTYTMTATDRYSCKDTESVVVSMSGGSLPTFSISKNNVCGTDTVLIKLTSTVDPLATYNWNFGGGTVIAGSGAGSTNPYIVKWTSTGTKTVSLTLSGTSCGSSPVSQTVTVNAIPTANAGTDKVVCSGNTVTLGTAGVATATYAWTPNWGLSSAAVDTPHFTQTNAGTNPIDTNFILTVTENGCTAKDTVKVSLVSSVTTSFTVSKNTLCQNDTVLVTYTGNGTSGLTYNWSFGGGTVVAGSGMGPYIIKWNSAGTKSISLAIVAAGCAAPASSASIIVNTMPVANAGTDKVVCSGNTVTLGTAGVATATYAWTPNWGLSSTAVDTPHFTQTNSGTNPIDTNFILTVTENGCTAKDTVKVSLVSSVTTSFTVSKNTLCQNDTVLVTYTGNGTSGLTYNWSFGGGTVLAGSGMGPYIIKWNSAGTKSVSLAIVATGCAAPASSATITVNPIPVANAGADATTCSGVAVAMGTTTVAGTSYSWTPTTYLSSGAISNPTFSGNNATSADIITNYILVATANGCTARDSATITLAAAINGNFTISQTSACQNSTVQLLYNGNAPATATYNWNFGGGTVQNGSGQGPINLSWNTVGTQTVTLQVVLGSCSSTVVSKTITITAAPAADAGFDKRICSGGTDTIGVVTSPTATYAWSNGNFIMSNNVARPAVNWINNGSSPISETYVLTVTENGCNAYDTVTVTADTNLSALVVANGSTNKCTGDTLVLKTDAAYASVLWSNGATTDSIIVTQNGNFGYEAKNINGCIYISNIVSVGFTSPPTVSLVNNTPESCIGKNDGSLTVAGNGGTPAYTYLWSNSQTTPTNNNLTAGNYTVTVYDNFGCKDTQSFTIITNNTLSLVLDSMKNVSCFGLSDGWIKVSANQGTAPYRFLWNNNDSTALSKNLSAGNYSVTVTDAGSCTATGAYTVSEPPAIVSSISNTNIVNIGESTLLDLTVSPTSNYSYLWTNASTLSCSTCEDPTASPIINTNYSVIIVDNTNGCKDTAYTSLAVDATKRYYIPTAFSPNGDGKNDVFMVYTRGNIVKYIDLKIYNRWGELVYSSNDINKGWDGTYNGVQVNNGLYTYMLKLVFNDKEVKTDKGSISLIK